MNNTNRNYIEKNDFQYLEGIIHQKNSALQKSIESYLSDKKLLIENDASEGNIANNILKTVKRKFFSRLLNANYEDNNSLPEGEKEIALKEKKSQTNTFKNHRAALMANSLSSSLLRLFSENIIKDINFLPKLINLNQKIKSLSDLLGECPETKNLERVEQIFAANPGILMQEKHFSAFVCQNIVNILEKLEPQNLDTRQKQAVQEFQKSIMLFNNKQISSVGR